MPRVSHHSVAIPVTILLFPFSPFRSFDSSPYLVFWFQSLFGILISVLIWCFDSSPYLVFWFQSLFGVLIPVLIWYFEPHTILVFAASGRNWYVLPVRAGEVEDGLFNCRWRSREGPDDRSGARRRQSECAKAPEQPLHKQSRLVSYSLYD